jgi:hypothetical protein
MRGRRFIATLLFLEPRCRRSLLALRLGYVDRFETGVQGRAPRLAVGDFPAGVTAPVDDVASIPTRPGAGRRRAARNGGSARLGCRRRRSAGALSLGLRPRREGGALRPAKTTLRRALVKGGENGGVDLAALSVSTLGMSASPLRDAAPRTLMLLGRSRGQDVLPTREWLARSAQLVGKRVGAEPRSPGHYFTLLWSLSRVGLAMRDVELGAARLGVSGRRAAAHRQGRRGGGLPGRRAPDGSRAGRDSLVTTTADAPTPGGHGAGRAGRLRGALP